MKRVFKTFLNEDNILDVAGMVRPRYSFPTTYKHIIFGNKFLPFPNNMFNWIFPMYLSDTKPFRWLKIRLVSGSLENISVHWTATDMCSTTPTFTPALLLLADGLMVCPAAKLVWLKVGEITLKVQKASVYKILSSSCKNFKINKHLQITS